MSWHHFHHVLKASPLTGALYAVHLVLAHYADDDGICWPAQKTLAQDARVSRRSVIDALQALEDKGLLSRQRTPGKYNSYTLALGPLEGCKHCPVVLPCADVQRLHTPCAEVAHESPGTHHQEKTPDPDDAPDVEEGCSIGRPPAAAALAVVAPLQQASASVEEGESPAPCQTPVLPAVQPEAAGTVATHEVPAEPLAAPQGTPGDRRAVGACPPGVPPPEFGVRYQALRWLTPQEVGHVLDERGLRAMALGSPTLAARVAAMYQEELAHA